MSNTFRILAVNRIAELEAENKKLEEFAYESLGMQFNEECVSCAANQAESCERAEYLYEILKG